jgi:hypothetical protein
LSPLNSRMARFKATLPSFLIFPKSRVLKLIGESLFIGKTSVKLVKDQIKIRPNKVFLWPKLAIPKGHPEIPLQYSLLNRKLKMSRKGSKILNKIKRTRKNKKNRMSCRIKIKKKMSRQSNNHSII